MQPLRIEFKLGSPMVMPNYPLHLDALLAYIYTQKSLFLLGEDPTREALLALAEDLPFQRCKKQGDWVYMASALQPEGDIEKNSRFFTTRHNTGDLCRAIANGQVTNKRDKFPYPKMSHASQLDFNRGHQRNALMYHSVATIDKLVAYCVGDKALIEESFQQGYVTHLGKHRRLGMGAIESISVIEDDDATERWKMRVRHFEEPGDVQVESPLRPPYWDTTKALCFMPAGMV